MRKVQEYILYFILYSIIGWCYEVFLEVIVCGWDFPDRGFLVGPYCIVYGFGALIFICILNRFKYNKIKLFNINITPILMFLMVIFISTTVELIASYIMEFITGSWMWDYTNYSFNFEGRIALNPSVRFGIGGIIFLYLVQPLFEKITNKLNDSKLTIISSFITTILIIDLIYTLLSK